MASGSAVMASSQVPSMEQLGSMKSQEDGVDENTKRKRSLERTLWTRIWQGVAAASIVVNIVAMAIEQSAVSIVAGIIAVLIAPVVIKRQFDLQDTDCKFDGGGRKSIHQFRQHERFVSNMIVVLIRSFCAYRSSS
jgi:hypothetical protein